MLPGRVQPSTFGTEGLNFCVRDGNRWDPFVIATGNGEYIPPHIAAAALAHPDNCTGEDSSSDLHVVSFVDLIRQATRFANAECRMLNVECFLLRTHFILRSAFFILPSLFPSAFRSAVIKPSTD